MKVIVAVDIRHRSSGALRFATWLCAPAAPECLHILRESYVRHAVAFRPLQDVIAGARHAVAQAVRESAVPGASQVTLERSEEVSQGLLDAQSEGDVLVIGRHADSAERTPLRLGSVARRTLRRAKGTTIVVPPDLARVGAGPVVVATKCDAESTRALAFARKLASDKGRALHAVHAVPVADYLTAQYISSDALAVLDAELLEDGRRRLESWGREHALPPESLHLVRGEAVGQLVNFALSQDAALVVAAPRRRNGLERLVLTSFSAELAGRACCPVALVPDTRG